MKFELYLHENILMVFGIRNKKHFNAMMVRNNNIE